MFLGKNGLYVNHILKGSKFISLEDDVDFIVDDVYVHWFYGYYYVALARNKHNSHTQIICSINCTINWMENIQLFKLVENA